ncbi:hypothetical protein FNJ88_00115 [Chryseobacterium sp. SNU WT5]|uniref:hypothetical protein n=1 Tax=Chryseobacterium sp. SNU WT5 TaxID=2594269 RepID=UPI0011804D52|nr:hypothetical protein [Chryseobacterium sp. SNU WT5]QDP84029.1 hypothetical protein FNJ88_00115 [Chryseobacterium sp. SNU WT5]
MKYWSQEVASSIQILLVVILFVLLLIKRKKLGKEIIYFLAAGAIVMVSSVFLFIMRISEPTFSIPVRYNMMINFSVFILFFLYFRGCLESRTAKKINIVLSIIFVISFVFINIFFGETYKNYPLLFYFIQVILLLINIFLLLHQTFNSNKILKIKSYYPFWVSVGLMANYVGTTPLLIITHTPIQINSKIFFIILFIVNFIGYSILILGALLAENITKKSEFIRD